MASEPTTDVSLAATGELPQQEMATHGDKGAGTPQVRLQEVLPQIQELAQHVGGMKKLAEITATLAESKEG